MLVRNGERIAVAHVAGPKLSLEIGSPEVIGSLGCGRYDSRVLIRTPPPLHHQPAARQEICGRARSRPLCHAGMPIGENTQKLSCSPEGMLTPKLAYEICQLAVDAMRTMVRGSAPIAEPTSSFLLVSREPLSGSWH